MKKLVSMLLSSVQIAVLKSVAFIDEEVLRNTSTPVSTCLVLIAIKVVHQTAFTDFMTIFQVYFLSGLLIALVFSAHLTLLERVIAVNVCLSVCLSHACTLTKRNNCMQICRHRTIEHFSSFLRQNFVVLCLGVHPE